MEEDSKREQLEPALRQDTPVLFQEQQEANEQQNEEVSRRLRRGRR